MDIINSLIDVSDVELIVSTIDTIDAINNSEDVDSLFQTISDYTQNLGFRSLTIGLVVNSVSTNKSIQTFGKSNLPKEIQDTWFENNFIIHDPIVRYALKTDGTFLWSEALKHAKHFEQTIPKFYELTNIYGGFVVPTKIKNFPRGVFSMSHLLPFSIENIIAARIKLVCIHAYSRLLTITKAIEENKYAELTKREIDVLHYIVAGKTNWEVGKIYGISEHSVKKHMRNIQRKLGATNRVQASVIAIKSGQIIP